MPEKVSKRFMIWLAWFFITPGLALKLLYPYWSLGAYILLVGIFVLMVGPL